MPSPGTTWRRSAKDAKFLKIFENTNVLDVSSSKQEVVNQPPKNTWKMVMAACLAGISWIGWAHCRATSLEKQCQRKGHPHWPLRLIFKPKAAKRKISRNEISPTVTQSNFVLSIANKQQPLWQPAPPCGTWAYKWQNRLLQVASDVCGTSVPRF